MPEEIGYLIILFAVQFSIIVLAIICGSWFFVLKFSKVGDTLEMAHELTKWYGTVADLEAKNNELNEMLYQATQRITFQEKNQGDLNKRLDEQYWRAATDIATLYNEHMPDNHILALNKKNRLALFSRMLNGDWQEVGYWDYDKRQLMYYTSNQKKGN